MRALIISVLTVAVGIALFFSCGKGDGTDRSGTEAEIEARAEENDTSVVEAIDSLTEALADDADASGAALTTDSENDCGWSKSCEVEDTEAVVTRSIDCTREKTVGRATLSTSLSGELTRVWQKPELAETTCKNDHADVDLSAASSNRTRVNVTFERTWERTRTITPRKGEPKTKSVRTDASGSRDITFSNLSATSRTKTLDMEVTRSRTTDGVAEKERTVTADDVVITNEFDATSKAVISHTVKSGSVVTELEGGSKLTKTFENVTWVKAGDQWCCVPAKGKLTAVSLDADGEILDQFVVEFAAADDATLCPETATLTPEGESSVKFSNFDLDCDLLD